MTSAATLKREAIATELRTALADLPGGWSAYASQRDVVSLPCVVVGARDPYREPLAFRSDATGRQAERLNLWVGIFVRRDAGNEALDIIDEAFERVLEALDAVDFSCAWSSLSEPAGQEVAGAQVISASVDVEAL